MNFFNLGKMLFLLEGGIWLMLKLSLKGFFFGMDFYVLKNWVKVEIGWKVYVFVLGINFIFLIIEDIRKL